MILTSSFEVYGELNGQDIYSENMSGMIDQTILRNGYPESKRCCELLVRSYVEEFGINAVIARLPSVYGPTMLRSDSKAHAQFIRNALNAEVAKMCAEIAGTTVVFDLPDEIEEKGFSRSKNCILDNTKLRKLGWNGKFTLRDGLTETLAYLKDE